MSEIDKPDHYAPIGGVYPIDITEHLPHCLAAAVEYLWRAGKKPGQDAAKDYNKAAWYLRREAGRMRGGYTFGVSKTLRAIVDRVLNAGVESEPLGHILCAISDRAVSGVTCDIVAEMCDREAAS